jgi:hypothetical protein
MSLYLFTEAEYCCSLVKMVCESAIRRKSKGEMLTRPDVVISIRRNFGGLESLDPVETFTSQEKQFEKLRPEGKQVCRH